LLKEITTQDGSITYLNEEINDTYHSKSGAAEEAKKKYAEQVKKFLTTKDEIVIYDVCFGLGYNTAAAIDEINNKKLRIYCFENDKKILTKIPLLKTNFKSYNKIKKAIHEFLTIKKEEHLEPMIEIRIVYGDMKKRIKEIREKADYVFFDPFSPSKSPEMWTYEIFKDIYEKMNNQGLLFTYSCAKQVRENMIRAGFEVIDGPIVGRRSPSTIAKKN
jgi:tRNA U34 5-methylaminomethyl-2-thiouridine-forming methyltransferase MnmC